MTKNDKKWVCALHNLYTHEILQQHERYEMRTIRFEIDCEEECLRYYEAGEECFEYNKKEDKLECLLKRLNELTKNFTYVADDTSSAEQILEYAKKIYEYIAKGRYDLAKKVALDIVKKIEEYMST